MLQHGLLDHWLPHDEEEEMLQYGLFYQGLLHQGLLVHAQHCLFHHEQNFQLALRKSLLEDLGCQHYLRDLDQMGDWYQLQKETDLVCW